MNRPLPGAQIPLSFRILQRWDTSLCDVCAFQREGTLSGTIKRAIINTSHQQLLHEKGTEYIKSSELIAEAIDGGQRQIRDLSAYEGKTKQKSK